MGQTDILEFSGEARRVFMRALLYDLRALEHMLDAGLFEEGIARIGAEQEVFLIDRACHAANASLEMLAALDDPHFTTELGLFQLEINLDPHEFKGDCLHRERHENLKCDRDPEHLLHGALPRSTRRRQICPLTGHTPMHRPYGFARA